MTFEEILDQAIAMLQRRGRLTYGTLKRQFQLDDAALDDLKNELIEGQHLAVDERGNVLVWRGEAAPPPAAVVPPPPAPARVQAPLTYTPPYLAEKILTSRSALEGERKQVTVLFADLKGSMELLAERDPEDARQLLDPVLECMMDAVHRYEGTVNQVMGDGIMALFGAPIAHEDHAVRACYAALRMQETVKHYAIEVQRTQGVPLQIRVGLNSGEVVVRAIGSDLHMDYTAVGQTTHLAARMEQMAMPGSILITAEVLRVAEGYVQVQSLGPVPVKGLRDPITVYEVVGAQQGRTRLQVTAARGLTRFVGRDHELETLCQALARAGAGQGQVVAVVGEAGVGKSRLVYECVRSHHTQGWRVLESTSVSYGKATPYFPVIELVKRYAQVAERDDTRTIRAKVSGQVVTLDEALQDTIPALLALLEVLPDDSPFRLLEPPQRRQRTLTALKRVLLRESQVQPLLLVCEDLHWIDAETQALLDSLVESLPTARLLLLVNYRPEYQHGWGSKTYYTQLRLAALPPASVNEFLHALLGDASSLAPLKQLLIARTEGNPFFLEESVRTLVETEGLVGVPGAYRLAHALTAIQVPATVQAVLAARIDRLPPEEKRLLQTAAVLGTEVPFLLLQAMAEAPEAALQRGLAHLQAAEFLYETRLFPDLAYTFKHALTHEVAYNAVLLERRRVLHERAAQAIERLLQDRLPEHYPKLAHHYSRSGNTAKAVDYLHRAGQQAVERSAYNEAISHLTTAIDLLTTLPESQARHQQELVLQIALGTALRSTKGSGAPDVGQAYARARELCQHVGEEPEGSVPTQSRQTSQLFPVLAGLRVFYSVRGEHQTSRELAEQLLTVAQYGHDPALLLQAYSALGNCLFFLGEFVAARVHLEAGMALYDPQQHRALTFLYGHDAGASCASYTAFVLWMLGYPDQALHTGQVALTRARELLSPSTLANILVFTTTLAQFRRDAHAAQEYGEAIIAIAREQGFARWLAGGTFSRGWAMAQQGQRAEGLAEIRAGLAAEQATGAELARPYHFALLAEAYGHVGQGEAGLRLLDEACGLVAKNGERWWEAELYRLKGELLLAHAVEHHAEAEACFRQALAVACQQQAKSLELRAATSLARLWQQQGKRADARELLAPVYSWFTEGFDTVDLQEANALLETLA
jgi:class 3 adenylate cyclase/predicted ATPase